MGLLKRFMSDEFIYMGEQVIFLLNI